ncbi:MAG: hypothetical protein JSS25_08310 [Proteobacteria bacterium]|nr:hypothetical protein [Pseudomonadota bacterium]
MADFRLALLLVPLLAACVANAHAQDLSSQRDYSDPAQRDRPIACKPGDIEIHPGETLGRLFGSAWPVEPAPSKPENYTRARLIKRGPISWPHGLSPEDSIDVVAVLVDPNGKPLKAETLCSTRMGLGATVRRAVMEGTYTPATLDGRPVTSVIVLVQRVHAMERARPMNSAGS